MSQSRRIDRQVVRKLGRLAVAIGAAWLVASFALLVLIGPSSGSVAAAATPATTSAEATAATPAQAVPTSSCSPLTESGGTCYNAGEFCPSADLYMSGVAENGSPIACEPDGGQPPHWELCTRATSAATAASTAVATPICPTALAGTATPGGTSTTASTPSSAPTGITASATAGATTSGPAGAPTTGGGTGPGTSGTLAAAGGAVIVAGAGLVLLSRRRSRRRPA